MPVNFDVVVSCILNSRGCWGTSGALPCAECVELSLLALNSTETVLSETVMLCSTPDAVMLDDTLANLHSSLVPWETRMHFQRCVMLVTISCCSSVALQLMHQCLYTAPSHVAAVETPSRPLCDSGCLGSAGGRKCPLLDQAPSWQRLADRDREHSPGSPQSNTWIFCSHHILPSDWLSAYGYGRGNRFDSNPGSIWECGSHRPHL